MTTPDSITLMIAIAMIGFLYSSVGHAGASGYIAVLSLAGLTPVIVKPTALTLNIAVATVTAFQFFRAGHFSWSLFWPFALLAAPLAFTGGYLTLPAPVFNRLVGAVLLYSAWRLFMHTPLDETKAPPARSVAVASGGAIGLLSGLTGTGGGIFLTPLMLFNRWATAKQAAAVSAFFILLNSSAGLAGVMTGASSIPALAWMLIPVALIGGALGSHLGSRHFNHRIIKRLLSIVLIIAGFKLLWS